MNPPEGLLPLLDHLLADQRARWGRGERLLVEAYVQQHPALSSQPEWLLDLIYNEVFLREQRGETPLCDDYLQRFPPLAAQLRVQFAVHQAIQPEGGADLPEVPGHEVLGEIGRGGMGVVYQARDRQLGRRVAVKMLRPEHCRGRAVRKRFLTEARAVAVLDHPHIVKVHAAGEAATGPYLVMELLEGPSLAALLAQGALDVCRAVNLLIPVAEAVHYAHSRGIIHRDLKPANVMLDGAGQPRVMDFGMAKVVGNLTSGQSSTQQGTILGTPSYMPPEQAGESLAKPGPYNDVYSLGAILHALLTGRPPYDEGALLLTLLKVKSPVPPPAVRSLRPEVPERLERLCLHCLSKRPADRPASALALAEELRHCAADLPGKSGGASAWTEGLRGSVPARPDSAPGPGALPQVSLRSVSSGELIVLEREVTLLGRATDCDVILKVPEVSRRHCRIMRTPGQVIVEDYDSAQGTRVNGFAVARMQLQDGDRLEIAREVFQVRVQASP